MTAAHVGRRLRAIVVDDTPDLRELLCLALESSGEIEVVAEAGNGLEGVHKVRALRPDVVLIDLAMPVMDGLEALPHLREAVPDATIVVLSGFGAAAMGERALRAGANGYLQKGAPPSVILDYVRGLVGYAPSALRLVSRPERAAVAAEPADAVALAPFGVITVCDDDDLTVVSLNPCGAVLLGRADLVDASLAAEVPQVATCCRAMALEDQDASEVTIGDPPRALGVTVRRADRLLHIYLHPSARAGEDGLLRRAIATTAHEIRNPVTVLVGIADTVRDRGATLSEESWERLRASVVRQTRQLDNLSADLLTAAQAHRGTLRIDCERADLHEVLEGVVADQFPDVLLEHTGFCSVIADPLRLEQMVTNLLSNAHKYGAPPVTVRCERKADLVLVHVEDRGPGVPESMRDRLFDEFTRAGEAGARGTGLGLYVVRSLAVSHGGDVAYAPRAGGGSVFTLALPGAP